MRFHPAVLGPAQQRALRAIGPFAEGQGFYLAGGTALALQLGHRRSVDLDWFTISKNLNVSALAAELRATLPLFGVASVQEGTLHGSLNHVRVSFLVQAYPLLRPPIPYRPAACHLAASEDIAAMKVLAIAQRGKKRDFVDLHAIVRHGLPLARIVRSYQTKYGVEDLAHVLYSLVYFDDADPERAPALREKVGWRQVKADMRRWVGALR